ncbi:GBP-domain-containing protein [Rhizophagus irregularis]|uniref:GBP-domain-containing protein n=1 Tax=Rhizophagus irregularis TaxID=588596 RepID=A0A2N0R4J3_9GLOM|nr:GBP-domain-containing protein [Rhizophagus irregularis]
MSKEKIGNKFGKGIVFRKGLPIQLLSYSEKSENEKFGQILLNPEALNILREINEPLAIISVVGSFCRGKSYFANVLHGRHDSFDIEPNVEGCTHGIYMWAPPFKLTSEQPNGKTIQKHVLVLDSEGINDPSQDENWTTKLFILCLVIFSTFIYNINGIVNREDIGKLHLMTDLIILLRDFVLENPGNFKDYFLKLLNNINTGAAKAIRESFHDFDVYGLSPSGCKKKMLQHMEEAKINELVEEFVEEVVNAVKSIYSQLPLKYISSSIMKGISFAKFLEDVIECMNSSETLILLSIPDEYESIIRSIAQELIKESIEKYEERMNNLMNEEVKLPMLWEEFENMHHKYISEVNKIFFEKIIGSSLQIERFLEQLIKETSKSKEEFVKKNSKELMHYNENIAKEFWTKHVETRLNKNLFKNNKEFQEALKLFESDYNKSTKKSPETTKRLRLEALAREEVLLLEIEALKHEKEEYEKNINNKILESQTNIEQQNKLQGEMKRRFIEEQNSIIKLVYQSFDDFPKNEEIKKLWKGNNEIKTKKRKICCCMCVVV